MCALCSAVGRSLTGGVVCLRRSSTVPSLWSWSVKSTGRSTSPWSSTLPPLKNTSSHIHTNVHANTYAHTLSLSHTQTHTLTQSHTHGLVSTQQRWSECDRGAGGRRDCCTEKKKGKKKFYILPFVSVSVAFSLPPLPPSRPPLCRRRQIGAQRWRSRGPVLQSPASVQFVLVS